MNCALASSDRLIRPCESRATATAGCRTVLPRRVVVLATDVFVDDFFVLLFFELLLVLDLPPPLLEVPFPL
jgi:hypothetical protein